MDPFVPPAASASAAYADSTSPPSEYIGPHVGKEGRPERKGRAGRGGEPPGCCFHVGAPPAAVKAAGPWVHSSCAARGSTPGVL